MLPATKPKKGTKVRSYLCPNCGGTVSIPDYNRTLTLDMVRKAHEACCPAPPPAKGGRK